MARSILFLASILVCLSGCMNLLHRLSNRPGARCGIDPTRKARWVGVSSTVTVSESPNSYSAVVATLYPAAILVIDEGQRWGDWVRCCANDRPGWIRLSTLFPRPDESAKSDQGDGTVRVDISPATTQREKRAKAPSAIATRPMPKESPKTAENTSRAVLPQTESKPPKVTVVKPLEAELKGESKMYKEEGGKAVWSKLRRGQRVLVFPGQYATSRIRILDVATSRDGWVEASTLKQLRTIDETSMSGVVRSGVYAESEPKLILKNNCDRKIVIFIDGVRHEFAPNQSREYTMAAGVHYLWASAAGVTPDNDRIDLSRGNVLTVTYSIVTTYIPRK